MSSSSRREPSGSKHTKAPSSSKSTTVASKHVSSSKSSSSTKPSTSGYLSKPQGTAMAKLDASVRPSSSSRREPTQKIPTKLSSRLETNASSSSRRESSQGLATRIPISLQSRPGPSMLASSSAVDRLKTILKTKHDVAMASRQLKIDTLSRSEKTEQENWALGQLKTYEKSCPANLPWKRIPEGYQCYGGGHIVTHALLAEGKGGLLYNMGDAWTNIPDWQGPFYGQDIADSHARRGRFAQFAFPPAFQQGYRPSPLGRYGDPW